MFTFGGVSSKKIANHMEYLCPPICFSVQIFFCKQNEEGGRGNEAIERLLEP